MDSDRPPGASLCIDDSLNPEPDQVIPKVGFLSGTTLTIAVPSVRESLEELAAYAEAVRRSPFRGDGGAGRGVLLVTRYQQSTRFEEPVRALLEVTRQAYEECLRIAVRPEVRSRIDAMDVSQAYFSALPRERGLNSEERQLFQQLALEYPSAPAERKWEIYRIFKNQGWGMPF